MMLLHELKNTTISINAEFGLNSKSKKSTHRFEISAGAHLSPFLNCPVWTNNYLMLVESDVSHSA